MISSPPEKSALSGAFRCVLALQKKHQKNIKNR